MKPMRTKQSIKFNSVKDYPISTIVCNVMILVYSPCYLGKPNESSMLYRIVNSKGLVEHDESITYWAFLTNY